MPRYFFDVADGRCAPDPDGLLFVDDIEARREAIRRAAMLLKAVYSQEGAPKNWRVGVRDENGIVVYWIDAKLGVAFAS